MKKLIIFVYGLLAYAMFFGTILYSIGFVGNILVPVSIDSAPVGDTMQAVLIDLALLGLFAVQHSVMARTGFKKWWTQIIPEAAERSTYVLLSSLALIALYAGWQPLGGVIWTVTDPLAVNVLYGVFALGWTLVFLSSFLINHFDLFGLRQVTLQLMERPYTPLKFKTPFLYNFVRHPLYFGLLLAFWATPNMTVTHLFFAIATTGYILIGIQLEERDLARAFPEYSAYRDRVSMLLPWLGKSERTTTTKVSY